MILKAVMLTNKYIRVTRYLVVSCIYLYSLFFLIPIIQAQTQYETASLSIQINNNNSLTALQNKLSHSEWLTGNNPVFKVEATGSVQSKLQVDTMPNGEIRFYLSITNSTRDSVVVSPVFPMLSGLAPVGGKSANLYFLFPRQGGWPMNEDNTILTEAYSGNFPLQFIDIYDTAKKEGIYMISQDTTNAPKQFYLNKLGGKISMGIKRRPRTVAPGETWTLPPIVLGAHRGDWHEAFFAYRKWLRTWYKPTTPRKQWFRDIYNFRQVFLHPIFGGKGAWNPVTKKIDLVKEVTESNEAFGGVEYVHIFDWGQTPQYGRTGDYDPWQYLGGIEQFQQQVQLLYKDGIHTGLYTEGYLVSKKSRIGKAKGSVWQMLDNMGKTYTRFGNSYYYMCPWVPGWRDYISGNIARAVAKTGVDGSYVDQYGFGWQYGCYNLSHGHGIRKTQISGELQVPWEAGLMKQVKDSLPKSKVTYTEEMSTDVSTQYQDGSFTYAMSVARTAEKHNPAWINIPRFALPDFKLFEILHVDSPMGNDTDGIKHVFFNGEGLWLEGPLNNVEWFPQTTRALIRKTHAILIANKEAFRSDSPVPGVPTLDSSIYANYFPVPHKKVWTFYNTSNKAYSGKILIIPHKNGAVYYDAWNEKYIYPHTGNGFDTVSLNLAGNDAGCLVVTVGKSLEPPEVQGVRVCRGNTATFNIENPKGSLAYNWYSVAKGGTSIGIGNKFTTPHLQSDTTYYVESSIKSGCPIDSVEGCTSGRTQVVAKVYPCD